MDDTLFNSLFVADESATVTEKSETTAPLWCLCFVGFRVFVFFVEF